jgi:hypothetical protein
MAAGEATKEALHRWLIYFFYGKCGNMPLPMRNLRKASFSRHLSEFVTDAMQKPCGDKGAWSG